MDEQHKEALTAARASLERMQKFDPDKIGREDDMGPKINFKGAVPATRRLTGIYNRLSLDALDELTIDQLNTIRKCADRDFNHLDRILKFELEQASNPGQQRDGLIQQVEIAYAPSFQELLLYICHGVSRTADFKELERDARAANQRMLDEFGTIRESMEEKGKEAEGILAKIREAAAKRGVSEQAAFFKDEADDHTANATKWETRVKWVVGALLAYAVLSIFLPAIPWLSEVDTWQLIFSRTLVFIVLGYALFFCAKNYMANRHNAVVNRHRQNALMTYEKLVKANNHPDNADIVLTQAARFIYAPQDSGYTRGGNSDSGGFSIESIRRIVDKTEDK